MKIKIADSNRFGKLRIEDLKKFEERIGTSLPTQYRKHLIKHNGGYVDGARRLCLLHHIYGIHRGPDWARFPNLKQIHKVIPNRFLPIADDPGGNQICLALAEPNKGAIYFWDHERGHDPDDSFTILAPDFNAYLRGLAIYVAIARKQLERVTEATEEFGIETPVYAGKTTLDLVIERGSLRMIKSLAKSGARIRPDALIEAIRNKALNTMRFFLNRGVSVNFAIPETGFTALMLASSGDSIDAATLLLENGADPLAKNRWGKTAADLARSSKMKEILVG